MSTKTSSKKAKLVSTIFQTELVKKVKSVLRAISHPLRLEMMEIIKKQGSITVTELFIKMRLEQSVVSQHLAILRKAGVVQTIREGKNINYSLDQANIDVINNLVKKLY